MEIESQLGNKSSQHTSQEFIGAIRINPKNYTDAFINNPDGGPDIYIEGIRSRNAAMEGDLVRVKINHKNQWKLNRNKIADKWDERSLYLLPIIQRIESEEKISQATAIEQSSTTYFQPTGSNFVEDSAPSNGTKRSARNKRSIIDASSTKPGRVDGKLPSNLPLGISKLQVTHVLDLPIYSQCVQKTGIVTQVVKTNHSRMAGGFLRAYSNEFAVFSPTDSRVPRMLIDIFQCPLDFAAQPDRYSSTIFVAKMTEWSGHKFAKGDLVRIVGDSNQIQSRIETLLIENNIYDQDFPGDVYDELEYLEHLPSNWFIENSKNRRDLTKECIFTIDPKTARDLDDAVSIRQVAEQIYEVGVHIADVSYFVKELTAVDYHARLRTTSVYLVDRVIPMLPRILCEQICSLNPGQPKFTFSVIWKMDKYGRIIDQWFGRTIIKSCTKLAYEQAQDLIDNPNDISWIREGSNMPKLFAFDWKCISRSVRLLNKIAQNLRTKRFEDGALKIEQVKLKYELDPSTGFPTGFAFENRASANYLIEEFMLLANMAVAKRIYQHSKHLAFLRRHPPSSVQLMKGVKEFCDVKGLALDITSSGSIQKSLNAIQDPTMSKVVSFLLLRAMLNAEYICSGSLVDGDRSFSHFALNVPFYTHFTSPIRRYADVIVHRLLAFALGYNHDTNEDTTSLSLIADECTKRKITSKIISDSSQKLYFNLFVQKAGFCELLACVTRIHDQAFDVILIDYDLAGRVHLDKLKPYLLSLNFEIFSGVKRLILKWKPPIKTSANKLKKKKNGKRKSSAQGQSIPRDNLESRRILYAQDNFSINEAVNSKQVIEVFDVVRVIVTTDEKDISQLKINLKMPVS